MVDYLELDTDSGFLQKYTTFSMFLIVMELRTDKERLEFVVLKLRIVNESAEVSIHHLHGYFKSFSIIYINNSERLSRPIRKQVY